MPAQPHREDRFQALTEQGKQISVRDNRFQAMRGQGKQIHALLEQGKQIAGHERTGKTDCRP